MHVRSDENIDLADAVRDISRRKLMA